MSPQFSIAQSAQDEIDLICFLNERFDLTWVKRHGAAHNALRPLKKNHYPAEDLAIIRTEDFARVARIVKKGAIGLAGEGLSIEWDRTTWLGTRRCMGGRIYLGAKWTANAPVTQRLREIYQTVKRFVRRHYPAQSRERTFPTYVGPDLADRIADGKVRLVHGNMETMMKLKWRA